MGNPGSRSRRGLTKAFLYFLFAAICLTFLFPLIWGTSTSLKSQAEIYAFPPTVVPQLPTFDNYDRVLLGSRLPRQILNSVVVSAATIVASVFFGTLAAFGFSRWDFAGKNFLLVAFLFALMVPGLANLIAIYMVLTRLHLTNTYLALVIVYSGYTLPVVTWLMKTFIDKIPREIDEAAIIDGCPHLAVFLRIIVPVSVPGVVAAAVYVLITAWIEFIVALILITAPEMKTATVGVYDFISFHKISWGPITAASITILLPVLVFFIAFQKHIVVGLTRGAVKG